MKKSIIILLMGVLCLTLSVQSQPLYAIDSNVVIAEQPALSDNAILFSGNANIPLAQEVADYLGIPLGKAKIGKFNDGEIQIVVEQNVRNKEVFILQPTCTNGTQGINDNLMELFLLIRTMKRASADIITAVIPYYGYARQDRKSAPRVPISAADVAMLLEVAGADRILTIDLHCGQIQGFFHNAPVDNLYASTMFFPYFSNKKMDNVVVVSPDAGGVERAKKFMEFLIKNGTPARMAMVSKQRAKAGVIESMNLIGDVEGADAIIIDDMCDTAGTLVQAAKLIKDLGANRVFAVVTHPVFSGSALDRIRNSVLTEMVISNTIPLRGDVPDNITVISVAPLLGEAIRRIHLGESISDLFTN